MLNLSHPYLSMHWMALFLSYNELRALVLVNKDLSVLVASAIQKKFRQWGLSNAVCDEEKQCLSHVCLGDLDRFWGSPALYSLQLRCMRTKEYHALVQRDPRLSKTQKICLHTQDLRSPSTMYYWFVFDCLPFMPLRTHFSTYLCRQSLSLPYGDASLNNTNVRMRLNSRDHIQFECVGMLPVSRVSPNYLLCGVLTERNELWPTSLWTPVIAKQFCTHCSLEPFTIVCEGRSHCPFCGIENVVRETHSLSCMQKYCTWTLKNILNDINTFAGGTRKARDTVQDNVNNATASTSQDCVSSCSGEYRRGVVQSNARKCRS
jgi:hypothetical protein